MYLYVGKTLTCKNGELVCVIYFNGQSIWLEYNGKLYKKSMEILGITLFDTNKKITNPIYQGRLLKDEQGQLVKIVKSNDKGIWIEQNGKVHIKPKNALGYEFFEIDVPMIQLDIPILPKEQMELQTKKEKAYLQKKLLSAKQNNSFKEYKNSEHKSFKSQQQDNQQCTNCMLYRAGECIGNQDKKCEYYK